ncbi:unnamed protein product [Blepharisma stoltei]|uniref:Uncharacterized protein n=1 Tax=Blepharisma stoltei TaxID=1481888 RepID=A0AAU9J8R7_9CILI|nr:unnamed protein product [Blepharisma stoltei]
MEGLLRKQKEPGPYLHISFEEETVEEQMHMLLGFYKMPTLAYYGAGYPFGDMLCIIRANQNHIQLPQEILSIIDEAPEIFYSTPPPNKKGVWQPKPVPIPHPTEIKFYFIVSDISELIIRKGPLLNLVNHAWAFTEFQGTRKTKHIPNCIIPIEGFQEIENNGVKFGSLRAEYMSMHFKKGALCISPNNHKVLISPDVAINKCWTISLFDEEPRAYVTLQWLLTRNDLSMAFSTPNNLAELLGFLGDPLLDSIFQRIN